MALEELLPELKDTPLDCVRLREYNMARKIAGQAYSGKDDATLAELQFYHNKNLALELRKPDENFPPDNDLILKIAKVTMGTSYEEQLGVEISIPYEATL